MTTEDKQLLLVDLCGRLPYSPFVQLMEKFDDEDSEHFREIHNLSTYDIELFNSGEISNIKPYLRPMTSMTEEEKKELERLSDEYFGKALDKQIQESLSSSNRNESRILEYIASSVIVDWLNKNMFDYRGLINKGLAIEVDEENNPYGKRPTQIK